MTNKILTIADVLKLYKENDIETIKNKCFFDWFCRESSLKNKTIFLIKKLISILPSDKIDINKTTILFKNNCPCFYKKFDDIRILDIESYKVIYTIIPSSTMEDSFKKSVLFDIRVDSKNPVVSGSWKDIKNYFKN